MDSWYHAQSAARKWGGTPADYLPIEEFIDSSKQVIGDVRHRSIYHHTLGVHLCQRIFGPTLLIGRIQVPVKQIAERHILEDLGWLPTPADYLHDLPVHQWFSGSRRKTIPLSALGLSTTKEPA